jgi:hypothetical protein
MGARAYLLLVLILVLVLVLVLVLSLILVLSPVPIRMVNAGRMPASRKAASCRRTPKAEAAAGHDSPSCSSWCEKEAKGKSLTTDGHGSTRIVTDGSRLPANSRQLEAKS